MSRNTSWPVGPSKRMAKNMKSRGETVPEHRPDPKDQENHHSSELKKQLDIQKTKNDVLQREIDLIHEEERKRMTEAAPSITVSSAAREMAIEYGVPLAEIEGSGSNKGITVSGVRSHIETYSSNKNVK